MAASPMPPPGQGSSAGAPPADPTQAPGASGGQTQDVPMPIRQCAALSTLANQIAQTSPNLAQECQQITQIAQTMIRKQVLNSQQTQTQAPPL